MRDVETPSPPPGRDAATQDGFRADIQGLRALAVTLVVLYHAGVTALPGGYVGVDVFFVISGYVIGAVLLRELTAGAGQRPRLDFIGFYARRIRRLLPAAFVVVLTTLVAAWFICSPLELRTLAVSALATTLYFSNLRFALAQTDYLAESSDQDPLLHTWSLAVEEQFYLVWPLLLLALVRIIPSRHRDPGLIVGIGGLAALSLLASDYQTAYHGPWGFFSPWTRAWEFAAGMLAYLLGRHLPTSLPAAGLLVSAGGFAGVMYAALTFDHDTRFPGTAALVPVAGTFALLLGPTLDPRRSWWTTALGSPPLRLLGDLSYSWYLWHWPVFTFARRLWGEPSVVEAAGLVLATLALAYASFQLIEDPIRRGRRLRLSSPRWVATGLTATLLVAGVAGGLAWIVNSTLNSPAQRIYAEAKADLPILRDKGCLLGLTATLQPDCRFGEPKGRRTVVLFGDSHAAHWFPALDALADVHDWRLHAWVKSACPAFQVSTYQETLQRAYRECHAWREDVLARILSLRPDLVVLGNSKSYLRGEGRAHLPAARWQAGIASTLRTFEAAGIRVAVLGDTPWPGYDVPRCLSDAAWRQRDPALTCTFPDPAARAVAQLESSASAPFGSAAFVPTFDLTCPDPARCPTVRNGAVLYHDHSHLTAGASRTLAPALGQRLRAHFPQVFAPTVPLVNTTQ